MKQSRIDILIEQAKTAFFTKIEKHQHELLVEQVDGVTMQINDEIGSVLDTILDERSDDFISMLLMCCVEDPDLFTREPEDTSCITDNGSTGEITAAHCVYHNLYDMLRSVLEHAYDEWYWSAIGEAVP